MIAEALERTKDPDAGTGCLTIDGVKVVYERMAELREPLFKEESKTTTKPARGGRSVEARAPTTPRNQTQLRSL